MAVQALRELVRQVRELVLQVRQVQELVLQVRQVLVPELLLLS